MSPTILDDDKATRERKAAELFGQMTDLVHKNMPEAVARIAAVEKAVEPLKGVDPKAVVDKLAELDASHKSLAEQIRSGKRGGFTIPGGEDAAKSFNLLSVVRVVKHRNGSTSPLRKSEFEALGAGREFEALKSYQDEYHEDYVRMGLIARSQQIGNEELGGAFVPDQLLADIIGPIWSQSQIVALDAQGRTRARLLDGLVGGEVKIPRYINGMVSTWLTEEGAGAETLGKTGSIEMKPRKCGSYIALTEDMIRMGGFGFEQFLRADLQHSVAKLVDRAALYGKGAKDPLGVFNTPGVKVFRAENSQVYADGDAVRDEGGPPNWQGGELEYTKLDLMRVMLQRDDVEMGPSWATISCPDYFARLRNLKLSMFSGQTSEQAFLMGMPIVNETTLRAAIGDFGRSTQVPFNNLPGESIQATTASTTEKFTDVLQGNMDQIVVGRWSGTEITDDAGRGAGFLNDLTYVKIRQRIDIRVRQERELIFCPDARAIA